jgi:MFS family permease
LTRAEGSSAPAGTGRERGLRLLPAVFTATLLIRFGFGITLSVYAFYLGTSVGLVGAAAALAPALELSTVIFSGLAADRFGRLPVLRFGLALGVAVLLLMSTTRSLLAQGALSGVFGLASGAILASSLAFTGDVSPPEGRGREMGWFDAVNLAGWISGFASGYLLASVLPAARLNEAFWVGALAVLLGLGIVVGRARGYAEITAPRFFDWDRIRTALGNPDTLLIILPWTAIYMIIGALFTFLGPAARTLTIPLWELGLAILGGGAVLFLTQPFYGRRADRWGRDPLMHLGIAGFLGVLTSASVLVTFGAGRPLVSDLCYAGIGVSAFAALAFGPASLAALADLSKRLTRATTMALYSMMISAGMTAGILLASALFTVLGNPGVVTFFILVGVFLAGVTLWRRVRLLRSPAVPAA